MTDLKRYAAVVLAAGFSRRLPGENKLLRTYRGRPLLAHALRAVVSLGLGDAVAVTGGDKEPAVLSAEAGLRSVYNERAADGMGASIAAGVAALDADLAGVFIVLGDMPEVSADDFARLAEAHEERRRRICVPVWQGRRGHPVLFGADYFGDLAQLTGDVGARGILARQRQRLVEVPSSRGVLLDLDTAADFTAAETEPFEP